MLVFTFRAILRAPKFGKILRYGDLLAAGRGLDWTSNGHLSDVPAVTSTEWACGSASSGRSLRT